MDAGLSHRTAGERFADHAAAGNRVGRVRRRALPHLLPGEKKRAEKQEEKEEEAEEEAAPRLSFLCKVNSSLLVTSPMLMLLGIFGVGKPRRVLLVPVSRLVVLPS